MPCATNMPANWPAFLNPKKPEHHKYDHGHAAVLSGSEMTGAASLAAVSALRAGAGLVTVFSPSHVAGVHRAYCPSLIVREISGPDDFTGKLEEKHSAVVIGPGLGGDDSANVRHCVLDVLHLKKATVIDADGMTAFEEKPPALFAGFHRRCVLTPHEGEFRRLFPDIEGGTTQKASRAAARAGCVLVLKGHETVIADADGRCVVNRTGTPWLATAGTGDVLAGMIAGFAARPSAPVFDAACAAAWFHGRAAEIFGPGLISADIPGVLPQVWREISLGEGVDLG